jgi:hypothetical protein
MILLNGRLHTQMQIQKSKNDCAVALTEDLKEGKLWL